MRKQPGQILDPIAIEEQAKLSIEQWKINNNYIDSASTTSIIVTKIETKYQLDNIDTALSLIETHDSNHNLKHKSYAKETFDLEKGLRIIDKILKEMGVQELDHDLPPVYDAAEWYSISESIEQ